MFVGAAHIEHVLPFHSEVAHIDVGGDIHSRKMSDVHGAVGIRQRAGHEGSFVVLFHIYFILLHPAEPFVYGFAQAGYILDL